MSPTPAEWSLRYLARQTPWDMGGAHPELVKRLAVDATLGLGFQGTALVPGCGRGHDALALAEAGWQVTAIDFAAVTGGPALDALSSAGLSFEVGDALTPGRIFDLIFDHTFFCALEPPDRPRFGQMVDSALSQGGRLVSLVFPVDRPVEQGGPPYAMTTSDVTMTLGTGFRVVEESEPFCTGRRRWHHVWAAWTRVDPTP